jgi:hypothetical protein
MKQKIQIALVISVALTLVATINWRPTPSAARATTVPPTVTLGGDRVVYASPAAADLDGDGDKEIVIGARDGMLFVVAYDGSSWSKVWSRQLADDLMAQGAPSSCENTAITEIESSVAIADLDNDGQQEIIVTVGGNPSRHRNGGLLVYSFVSPWTFTMISGWPQPRLDDLGSGAGINLPDGCWDGFTSSAALGDLDGDGDLEIITEFLNRRIYAWHHDGSLVAGWPLHRDSGDHLLRGGESSPALGDIDGDGLPEVIIGTNSPPWDGSSAPDYSQATVWAINGDSTSVPNWPVSTLNNTPSSPALGDIDGDGELEIVIGSGKSVEGGSGNRVYAWNSDGSAVDGWPKVTLGDMPSSPALGDIDHDGDLEIVIGCGIEYDPSECTLLYAWHGNGDPVAGFPLSPPANSPLSTDPTGLPYPPVLADYDGDGEIEILVTHSLAWGLSVVEGDGSSNNDPALQTEHTLYSSPLVDDVDNDGQLEVVMAGGILGADVAAIYVQDVGGTSAAPWPMFMHDVRRTGNVTFYADDTPPQNPTLSSPSHTAGAWSNDNQVQVNLSGASDEESGLAGYYYLWDNSPGSSVDQSASWLEPDQSTLTTQLDDAAGWYVHLRAVNNARLLAADTVHLGPFHVDTLPPVSQASAPPCAVLSVAVSWSGSDAGSGLAGYDVQVRQQGSASWNTWQSATTATSGAYTDATGPVYQFRSLASDLAGNVETKGSDAYDAQTWLTQYSLAGTVYNVREQPVFMANITANPAVPLNTYTDQQGDFFLCHQDALTYSLTASRSDYGALPATQDLSGALSGLKFYLPPGDDALQSNGQFESGDWSGWWGSAATASFTDSAHSGMYAAALGKAGDSLAWSATISRNVTLPDTPDLTLSLVHLVSGNSTLLLGGSAWVAVQGATQTLSSPLASTSAWSHTWLDLEALRGQTVIIGLHLDSPDGGGGWLVVDELAMGAAMPGIRRVYLPLVLRQ